MEVEKLIDFLKSCCPICLSVENEMVECSNIVENFNKTIDQLLLECLINVERLFNKDDGSSSKICELCTAELVMVAKFHEKCEISANALDQIKRQISKMGQERKPSANSNNDTFYEHIVEYAEENVEYVIYDTSTDFIDEIQDSTENKEEDSLQSGNYEVCIL